MTLKKIGRDKEAKIKRIIQSTKNLVEEKGYTIVSIRDIAKEADVSIGLIYKYFPKGKFDILEQISAKFITEDFMIKQTAETDFTNFPGYIKEVTKNMLELHKKNNELIKAVAIAALTEDKILEDIKTINIEDYAIIPKFFNKFTGVNISNKDSLKIFTQWSLTIKSLIFYNNTFPTIFKDEEALQDTLIELSLKIWNYQPKEK